MEPTEAEDFHSAPPPMAPPRSGTPLQSPLHASPAELATPSQLPAHAPTQHTWTDTKVLSQPVLSRPMAPLAQLPPRPPPVRAERTRAPIMSECVMCDNHLGSSKQHRLDVAKLFGIDGLPAAGWCFCSAQCARTIYGARADGPKGQRLKARLNVWVSAQLQTELRAGDEVFMLHDMSSGVNVSEGDAVVTNLEFDGTQRMARLTCRYVVGGRAHVYPTGLRRRLPAVSSTRATSARATSEASGDELARHGDDVLMDRLAVAAATQQQRATAAAATAAAMQAALDTERRVRLDAEAAATEAELRINRAERAAERIDKRAQQLTSQLQAARADIEEFDQDFDSLTKAEEQLERERARLGKRVAQLARYANPTQMRKIEKQRAALASQLRVADVEMSSTTQRLASTTQQLTERDAEIKALKEQLAQQCKVWLPGKHLVGRQHAHDDTTRLLWAKLLTLRVPPAEIAEVVASVAYAVAADFPAELKKMRLPGDNFARTMRPELGMLHQMISAITVGNGEVRCFANDASPLDGRELGETVARVQSLVRGNVILRDTHLAGCYQTADSSSRGEALAIKEKCFDRMALVLRQLRSIHEKKHGAEATDAALPAADSVGMHRLAKTVGIGDNAAAAQKAIRTEAAQLVSDAVREHMGEEKWAALQPDEQKEAGKLYGANCHRHLGNTWIDGGAKV